MRPTNPPGFAAELAAAGFACGMRGLVQSRTDTSQFVFLHSGCIDPEVRREMVRRLADVRRRFNHGWAWGLAESAGRRESHVVLWIRPQHRGQKE